MKKIIYTFFITVTLLAHTSCSNWLDVNPASEIKSSVMFETEQGFKDAIIGCYIMMSDEKLYGGDLTCTFLDVLGRQYDLLGGSLSGYYNTSLYKYDSNTERIDLIWSKLYNIIANLNNIIENLETRKKILHPTNYAIIKAEAYGLRAFIYFDLIRMFSYGDLKKRPEKLNELAIPYVTIYDKVITKQHKLKEVLAFIHEDINTSIALFYEYDPLSPSIKAPDYETPNEDLFYDRERRSFRFNIRAAYATRMRLNMWEGYESEALKDVEYLIASANNLNVGWIPESSLNAGEDKDLTFSTEQLFGLETFKRFENVYKGNFKLTIANNLSINYQALYFSKKRASMIYEIDEGIGSSDLRYVHWFDKTDAGNDKFSFVKFYETEEMSYKNRMPLIKKAELYYVAAECLINKGGDDNRIKAIDYLNQVRSARKISKGVELPSGMPTDDVRKEIFKEWRKEFVGDGQMFYYFKRLGYKSLPETNIEGDDRTYVFPLPSQEIEFGGREDSNAILKE